MDVEEYLAMRADRGSGRDAVAARVAHPYHEGFDRLDLEALRHRPGVKWARAGGAGAIAAWVADMDFPPCPAVADRLAEVLATGDFGYPDWWLGSPLRRAFADRMAERFGWQPDPAAVREVTDLIQGVQAVLYLATRPGDAVAIHTPAYPPFLHSIRDMGRRLVALPMQERDGRWTADPAALDDAVAVHGVRTLLLVNPHNPTGRVFTAAELEAMADVARRRDLLVVSDEIHADLVYPPHRHLPFATLSDDAARRTLTLTSASKAFNLAGLRCAVVHYGPPDLLKARDAQPSDLFGTANLFGVHAALAAWSPAARPWSERLGDHLTHNRDRVLSAAGTQLPGIRVLEPEGTYLAWLDVRDASFTGAGAGAAPATPARAIQAAGVRISPGPDFGPGGEGFVRLNFATSAEVLDETLARIAASLSAG
jgi:cystathionine beta-lyase